MRLTACFRPHVVLLAATVLVAAVHPAFAAGVTAVLYPDIREPYRAVFLDIIRGINSSGIATVTYAVASEPSLAEVKQWLSDNSVDTVIALGNRGLRVARELGDERPVVVGAVLTEREPALNGFSGIVLTPDPDVLFQRLREIDPRVRRVFAVYNKRQNQWLMDRAVRAAARQGLTLRAFPAENIQESAQLFRDILKGPISGSDAIWLPQDSRAVDERAVLPFILQEAWNRSVAVFSSNPAHVRRGALFSLFPDNEALGRSLARLAKEVMSHPDSPPPRIQPLRDLLTAVNVRTAEHLGLDFSARELRRFDLVFPSP